MQTKEDKDRFFAELKALDDSETETESELSESEYHRIHGIWKPGGINSYKNPTPPVKPEPFFIDLITPPAIITPRSSTLERATSPVKKGRKRTAPEKTEQPAKKRTKKPKDEIQLVAEEHQIFKGLVFFFIPNYVISVAQKLRAQRTLEYGGKWTSKFDKSVTHVLVDSDICRIEAAKAFPNRHIPENTVIIRNTWFSESIRSKFLRDIKQSRFQLIAPPPPPPQAPRTPPRRSKSSRKSYENVETPGRDEEQTPPQKRNELDTIIDQVRARSPLPFESDVDEADWAAAATSASSFDRPLSPDKNTNDKETMSKNKGFQCMEPHTGQSEDNPNSKTIAILQEMATYYDKTGDHWRTTAYRKAISALQKQTVLIATREQAFAIPQIGTRLADKVEEIVTTNRLRRLESTKDDPHAQLIQLFMGIYDVGYKQASQWIAQGHRTLDDLKRKATLTSNQRVGIDHYDDFQKRIPRAEVAQHAQTVRAACMTADKDLKVIIGGSWRRGNMDSGDIDLLITKLNADMSQIRAILNTHVIPALTKSGFLKCALASSHSQNTGSKWHGASCLTNSTTWRRIDLLFVPGDELGAALLYFTGNDIFNRSMRLLASRKGMRLNQHGLFKDVMRGPGRAKMTDGTLVEGKDEKEIFRILGVPWREPWERKC